MSLPSPDLEACPLRAGAWACWVGAPSGPTGSMTLDREDHAGSWVRAQIPEPDHLRLSPRAATYNWGRGRRYLNSEPEPPSPEGNVSSVSLQSVRKTQGAIVCRGLGRAPGICYILCR